MFPLSTQSPYPVLCVRTSLLFCRTKLLERIICLCCHHISLSLFTIFPITLVTLPRTLSHANKSYVMSFHLWILHMCFDTLLDFPSTFSGQSFPICLFLSHFLYSISKSYSFLGFSLMLQTYVAHLLCPKIQWHGGDGICLVTMTLFWVPTSYIRVPDVRFRLYPNDSFPLMSTVRGSRLRFKKGDNKELGHCLWPIAWKILTAFG